MVGLEENFILDNASNLEYIIKGGDYYEQM